MKGCHSLLSKLATVPCSKKDEGRARRIIEIVVDNGGDLSGKRLHHKQSPLMLAINAKIMPVIQALFDKSSTEQLMEADEFGNTATHFLACCFSDNEIPILKSFLQKNTNLRTENKEGNKPHDVANLYNKQNPKLKGLFKQK